MPSNRYKVYFNIYNFKLINAISKKTEILKIIQYLVVLQANRPSKICSHKYWYTPVACFCFEVFGNTSLKDKREALDLLVDHHFLDSVGESVSLSVSSGVKRAVISGGCSLPFLSLTTLDDRYQFDLASPIHRLSYHTSAHP